MGREGESWNRSVAGRAETLHDLLRGKYFAKERQSIDTEGYSRKTSEDNHVNEHV